MVEAERLGLEKDDGEDGEDGQRDELLDDLERPEVEGTAVADVADTIGRHHERVLGQSDAPAEKDD